MTRRLLLMGLLALAAHPAHARRRERRLTIEGTVLQTFDLQEEAIVRVVRVTEEGSAPRTLNPPRAKRIVTRDSDLSVSVLLPGQSVVVTGTDRGRGRALLVSELRDNDAPEAPSAPEVDTPLTVPSEPPALPTALTMPDGTRVEGVRLLSLIATGYGPGENGIWGDQTKLETTVGFGTVAVDPRVIPLRTRLYVEGYGFAHALDVGGAIKGHRIDLAFDTDEEAAEVGRKRVRVLILG